MCVLVTARERGGGQREFETEIKRGGNGGVGWASEGGLIAE